MIKTKRKKVVDKPSLVRHDPSRTYSIRRRFIAEIDRRFKAIERELYHLIAKEDAFGLVANAYDPDEPRDEKGQWSSGGGEGSGESRELPLHVSILASALKAAKAFGLPTPRVSFSVDAERPQVSGEHGSDHEVIFNPEKGQTPLSSLGGSDLNKPLRKSIPESVRAVDHIIAHEVVHQAYSKDANLGKEIMGRIAQVSLPEGYGHAISMYGSMAGDFENAIEVGAVYAHSPEQLRQYSPELYAIAHDWATRLKQVHNARSLQLTNGADTNILGNQKGCSGHSGLCAGNVRLLNLGVCQVPSNGSPGKAHYHVRRLDNSQPTVINTRFAFHSTPEKVEAFRRWLRKMLSQHLAGDANKKLNDWWAKYCQEGYLQGAGRAFSDAKVAAAKYDQNELRDFYSGTKEEFLRSSFGRPVAVAKVKLLAGRVYTDLKGITDTMSAKLTRTLTDGLVQGKNPREIARDIVKNVEGIDRTRARLIAQTEIIRCHAEGQLDAFQAMGVDKVGVAAEWDTAHDDRVCPECDALDDVVMSVAEARGLLPRHPGCRCGWLPANVGEDHSEQVRDKEGVEAAIDASIEAEGGKNPQDSTSWQGADADIDEERPDKLSVLDYDPDEPRDDDGPITNAQQVLQVPNVRQTDSYGCGAAAVTGIARYFDLPHTLAVVKKALGTSPKKGTSPQAIVDYLRLLGLYVEAFRGMTVSDLEHYVQRGMPVICPVQDYGGGHYLTVIGVNDGYVICQDSSQDNVVDEDEDSLQAPGRKLVALVDWDKAWHDKDASGQVYDHYGIAVSKEQA